MLIGKNGKIDNIIIDNLLVNDIYMKQTIIIFQIFKKKLATILETERKSNAAQKEQSLKVQ